MYYLISKNEDGGLDIFEYETVDDLMDWLEDPEDLKTEAQIKFVNTLVEIENDNSDYLNKRLLISGKIIKPQPVDIIKRWVFDENA